MIKQTNPKGLAVKISHIWVTKFESGLKVNYNEILENNYNECKIK